ncbi:uncharacterized protein [Leptinotarsa decemlineata]|uniref:uncharacterized protein n=1 Tax=Leptinotarsa decemlineata TaxID=7539 RepID=UPI003D3078D8
MDENYVPPTKRRRCCVAGCTNRDSKRHRFPKNQPDVFNTWIERIKPYNYENPSLDKIYNSYHVCHEHFPPECMVPGTKRGLKFGAVPSLRIPDIKDNHSLPAEAEHTADFILFLDELFDSLNVSRKSKPEAKRLLTSNSGHSKFWKEALPLITRMRYFSLQKNKFILPPTLKNLHFTLRGFLYLKNILLTKFDFKYILTAAFNQDALENFFSYIRNHGVTNTKPDVSHFISSFKTLLANNFMSAHSPG